MQKYHNIFFIFSCLVFLSFLTCDKTPVGYNELGREMTEPIFTEFRPVDKFCYGKYSPLGAADYLVLGKNNEYESRMLIQFPLDTVTISGVTNLKVVLYPKHYNNIKFTVYPIMKISEWQEGSVIWNRAYEGQPWLINGGDYYNRIVARIDSLASDSCVFSLPITSGFLDTLKNNCNGLIFVPDSGENFATFNSRAISNKEPKIIFEYGTTSRTFKASNDAHIVNAVNMNPNSYIDMWLGAGYPFRTMLKFNVDSIPNNVTIAYAELVLPVQSYYSMSDTFDIGIWKVLDSTFSQQTSFADARFAQTQFFGATDTLIIFDLRNLVQNWVTTDTNFGILLSCFPENYEISRVKLKTGTFGPYLKIGYITPPKGRF